MSTIESKVRSEHSTGKVTLITGASSGLGAALAKRRAERGENLVLMARRQEKLELLAEDIRNMGRLAFVCAVDVTERQAVLDAVKHAVDALGPIDLLIANAGMGIPTPAHRFDASVFERVVSVNLTGAANCLEAILPEMLARDRGHIVSIASLAGYRGLPGSGAYCASKAGMRSLFESLRLDLSGTNVDVTTICPGFVKTPMTESQKFPMPFIMELDAAVDLIDRAIEKKRTEYAFPFPLSTMVRLARWFPNWLYDALVARKGRA
ncbi:MAG: SDR family NAD(P)-dependent oxidoreductase [Bradymonadia bacterium]